MKFSSFAARGALTCATVAIVAACSGLQQTGDPVGAVSTSQESAQSGHSRNNLLMLAKSTRVGIVPTIHHKRGKAWILPDAGKQYLLYASDLSKGTVDIYNYRVQAGKLYGQITGFQEPYGQCIDKEKNVYIVDEGATTIYEYAHGGITPINSAVDSYGYPIGCSVDPTTGNVAVANLYGFEDSGGIVIFAGGLSGTPTFYTDASAYFMWPPGYDRNGNLFVEGQDLYENNTLVELPSGSSTFTTIGGLAIGFPGSVQRWKTYMTATDQNYQGTSTGAIYTFSVTGSAATIVNTTQLTDNCFPSEPYFDAVQPFLNGTTNAKNGIVAGNISCSYRMDFFHFNPGGNPKRTLPTDIAPYDAWGQSVSPPVTM